MCSTHTNVPNQPQVSEAAGGRAWSSEAPQTLLLTHKATTGLHNAWREVTDTALRLQRGTSLSGTAGWNARLPRRPPGVGLTSAVWSSGMYADMEVKRTHRGVLAAAAVVVGEGCPGLMMMPRTTVGP